MKKILLAAFIFCFFTSAFSQSLQWATKVIEYSSQLTTNQYSAQQVLGKPNVLPAGGDNPNAWVPDKPKRKEFIKVGFDRPMNIRQVAVAESLNPGALYRVLVYDESGREYEINTLNPKAVPLKARMLNLFFETTTYKVVAVKLEFDGAAVPGYFGIDAIGITDSSYPVIADVPVATLLASGIVVEALDKNVNSDVSEFNPLLSPDGKTLYFSRRNHPDNVGGVNDKEDIWYSELDENGKWTLAKNLGSPINNEFPNFINSVTATPDGKSVIMILGNKYSEDGKKMTAGVSISSFENGVWTKPVGLNITNDYNMHEKANYFLSNTRQTLLMAVQRDDSFGDRDLYVTFMGKDSVWSEPLNLGRTINTVADESSPFLAADDKTLYFSSKGFSGYGGNDIYISTRLDDTWTNWSTPENLGPTINSTQEDLFFNIPSNSEYAYYSRGIDDNNTDIYRVSLPVIKTPDPFVTVAGTLLDANTKLPLAATIVYERLPDGEDLGATQSDPKTGQYEIKLPAGNLYGVRAEAKDHISESQTVDLRNIKTDTQLKDQNFTLQPIQVAPIEENVQITLNNIFFDFDKAVLKPESTPELNRIVSVMTERPAMQVEIIGHTCDIGETNYNLKLSQQRAEAVKKYLTENGVNTNRITVGYFGESQPTVPNTSVENRRKNRRVEFKIVKLQ